MEKILCWKDRAAQAARPKLGKLPKYSMDDGENFSSFIQRFGAAMRISLVPEDQYSGFLSACFHGRASSVIVLEYLIPVLLVWIPNLVMVT